MSQDDGDAIEVAGPNIFAALEIPNAEEALLKSGIAAALHGAIRERGLTQVEAARQIGISQPDLSNLLRGRLRGYSVERLLRMLTGLDRDIDIRIRPAPSGEPGRIRLHTEPQA